MSQPIAEIRSFNRFYTHIIGLLDEHLTNSPFSLPEARILYELAHETAKTAADLSRLLNMDTAQISRILTRFRARQLVKSTVSTDHAKQRILSLTEAGRAAFAALDKSAVKQAKEVLTPLDPATTTRLTKSMREIRSILGGEPEQSPKTFTLRDPRAGDLGWVVHRQAVLYKQEHELDWTFEGLISGIIGNFVANFDPKKEQAWIADRNGEIAGSVFLMRTDDPQIAKLRMLYVEPSARGLGIGSALVKACIERARELGYLQMTLWTNDFLISARRIYLEAGFKLVHEERHHSFGHDLVGQTWMLDL
ncbi:MarR family transcriptional regulator [Phyllobacterium sp. 628]|uniref:bifunctional helix-turn-helix transcriptional regulator/GNAT family N-acetyltransferase n=1 Tax=Phyllobacterium sp. 628 TaxID=2718938 RepID=UPI0016627D4F|nr:helix-turn-helix domain-containing GNAT family N-acetyltransferase [Phyllobacterium sp. 628]QND52860.1 MarR family transcriptional regulator [Phyllobacterium sp. 628]